MKKQAFISTICTIIALFMMSNSTFAQSIESVKKVKIYLKNSSFLPKGVGIKEVKLDASVTTNYTGMWMPRAVKMWEIPVGTRLEYIADKSVVMSGNAAAVKGKLIVEVKATDEGKTFAF